MFFHRIHHLVYVISSHSPSILQNFPRSPLILRNFALNGGDTSTRGEAEYCLRESDKILNSPYDTSPNQKVN